MKLYDIDMAYVKNISDLADNWLSYSYYFLFTVFMITIFVNILLEKKKNREEIENYLLKRLLLL